jgi:hypothetical protein
MILLSHMKSISPEMQRAVPDNQKDRVKRRNERCIRAEQYYSDQILAPGGLLLPLPNAIYLARRDRNCRIRDTKSRAVYTPYKYIPATGSMEDITNTLHEVLPNSLATSQCQDDHYWTEDVILDDEDIPNGLFATDENLGKNFELIELDDGT